MGVWKKFGIKNNFSSPPPANLNYDWSLKTVYYCQLKKGLVKHKNFQYVKKITVLCKKIKRIREEKEYKKKHLSLFIIIAVHNSISLTVFSHLAFNVLKFRFRDPCISSPLRLCQFVRSLGARGVTNNFPCLKARKIIRIWTKRAWNYSLISLVTIWFHIHIVWPGKKRSSAALLKINWAGGGVGRGRWGEA